MNELKIDVPFRVFPKEGFLNTQFQIITNNVEEEIFIYKDEELVSKVGINEGYITILDSKLGHGEYKFKVLNHQGQHKFEQVVFINNSYRFGTSILRSIYLFDELKFYFLVMKDRMLIKHQNEDFSLLENFISPDDIIPINEKCVLLVTNHRDANSELNNLGLYNLSSFSLADQLLDVFQLVSNNINKKILWLYNQVKKEMTCIDYSLEDELSFVSIKSFDNILSFKLNEGKALTIETEQSIEIVDVQSNEVNSYLKKSNLAIDCNGVVYTRNGDSITTQLSSKTILTFDIPDINLVSKYFIYIGSDFKRDFIYPENEEGVHIEEFAKNNDLEKSVFIYDIPEGELLQWTKYSDQLLVTINGVILSREYSDKKLNQIVFSNTDNKNIREDLRFKIDRRQDIIFYNSKIRKEILTNSNEYLMNYKYPFLYYTGPYFVCGSSFKEVNIIQVQIFETISTSNKSYLLIQGEFPITRKRQFFLYNEKDLSTSLCSGNLLGSISDYTNKTDLNYLWFRKEKNDEVFFFDFENEAQFKIDRNLVNQSNDSNLNNLEFHSNYLLSSSKVLISANSGDVKDSYPGDIISFSSSFDNIITKRGESFYLLLFNNKIGKYEIRKEFSIDEKGYSESYLHPSGEFLILKEKDQYQFYDYKKDQVIDFFSGKFLEFSKEGGIIYEDQMTRKAKYLDPQTFEELAPSNYHYYKFKSPDGKLYALTSIKNRYYDNARKVEITQSEYLELVRNFNTNNFDRSPNPEKIRYFKSNKKRLADLKITNIKELEISKIISKNRFLVIGVVGLSKELELPIYDTLQFFNYGSFSYDNRYFAYVGKPLTGGLIHFFELDFNEENGNLSYKRQFISKVPGYASWVCGFSKENYFATYDSPPNTYLLKCDFKTIESGNSDTLSINEPMKVLRGKNYLCFSPSGRFVALSDQGYDPISFGGLGHQKSTNLYVAEVDDLKIMKKFTEHGSSLKSNSKKDVIFTAFSEDESKLMSLSNDGVVLVRDIDLKSSSSEASMDDKFIDSFQKT